MDNTPNLLKSLVLVGMPGAGKTSVGAALATRLGLPFVDSDLLIEAESGCSIPQIFASQGEAAFRQLEHETLKRLISGPAHVISTGGGAFVQPRNHALLQQAITIWLKADLDLLAARTSRRTDRPLLQGDDPRSKLAALQQQRDPIYSTAHLTLEVDDRPVAETAARVLAALEKYLEQVA